MHVGAVFEDINYPGGNGRNRLVSSGIGIEGVTVELYNSINSLINSTTTNNNGYQIFEIQADVFGKQELIP